MKLYLTLMVIAGICVSTYADVSHILHQYQTTPEPHVPANPYVFSYQAGRAPGHVDRQHTEVSDGSGVVRGAFSYVDPRNQLRTVQYIADDKGFHPQLSHEQEDTEAVKLAKRKHLQLYNRIAQEHANPAAHGHTAASNGGGPANSAAVAYATHKHLTEFERIAAEHAALGAQQAAQNQQYPGDDGQYHPENEPHYQ